LARSASDEDTIEVLECLSRASAARSGFEVTIDASLKPGTASTSGAWNADPARP
jgi:hypothetical protein